MLEINKQISGKVSHSTCQEIISLSCSFTIPDKNNGILDCKIRVSVTTFSVLEGFRLCGIVLLPTFPISKGSANSPNSVFCNCTISFEILSKVLASIDRKDANSAELSLVACHEITDFSSSSSYIKASCNFNPF